MSSAPIPSPTRATFHQWHAGITAWEANAQIAGSFPSTNLHVVIPPATSDACCAAIAQRVRDNFPKGRKVYVEYTDENWNTTYPAIQYTGVAGNLGVFGTAPASGNSYNAYTLRAAQHHQTFIAVFNETDINGNTNRGGEIVCAFGSQVSGSGVTSAIINKANAYNAGSPAVPIEIDCFLVAPYMDMPVSFWPNPTVAATITTGGGPGGLLDAGNYYLTYTWVDSLSGQETAAGPQTAQFAVNSGDIPTATLPALPSWAASANIYLTAAGGASGSEVQYMTGVTGTTASLGTENAGSISPPTYSQLPSMKLAAASLASGWSTSIANGWPTPWTRPALLDYYRHWIKYNSQYNGPGGYFAQHLAAINSYNLQNGQSAPTLIGYEGSVQTVIPSNVETGADGSGYYLRNQLSHDVYYDPEIYNSDMAIFQMSQQGGMAESMPTCMCLELGDSGSTDGATRAALGYRDVGWPAGRPGRRQRHHDGRQRGNRRRGPADRHRGHERVLDRHRFSASPDQRFRPDASLARLGGRLGTVHRDAAQLAAGAGQARRNRPPGPARQGERGPLPLGRQTAAGVHPAHGRMTRVRTGELDRRLRRGRAGLSTRGRVNASAGIISITPGPLAQNVAAGATVSVVFAQAMNAATITTTSFTVTGAGTGPVAGTVAYTSGTYTATFTPTSAMPIDTFTIALSNSITTSAGTAISSTSSVFAVTGGQSAAPTLMRWFPQLNRLT